MCGIILIFSTNTSNLDILNLFQDSIIRRGPDYINYEKWTTQNISLLFGASVLWLQGKNLTKQPVENKNSIFVYNGDLFNKALEEIRGENGDTSYLFNILNESDNFYDDISKLQGPYAFIFLDKLKNIVYFGRDKFGRRSLLIGKKESTIILCSVAKRKTDFEFIELPSIGIFSWNLINNNLELYPHNQNYKLKLKELEIFLDKTIKVFNSPIPLEINYEEPATNKISLLNTLQGLNTNEAFSILLADSEWFCNVDKLKELLEDAVGRRVIKFCKKCSNKNDFCSHSSVGVLFSGGVDCSILALLADQYVDKRQSIDLFNVSFDEVNGFKSPDRITGLETLEELKNLCPDRNWKFIEIDISKNELDEKRKNHIGDLIYPLRTVLDDSLGCALWFASRGEDGSNCRVLLVGMGADELFGGYTKHRAAYKKESWLGLHNILEEDWQNLPYRNLARDDRVVSDHGRQLRTPYLDENVVDFVRNLQCWEKSCPSDNLPHGFGDKILLRSLAYHLGLKKAACLKKRALQFGSRIANKKEVARDNSSRL